MASAYDLHTHSTASDGTLSPGELVRRAAARGIGALALTDHDTTDGLAEAQAEAAAQGIVLMPGVELSVTWQGQTIHLVGLRIDPAAPALRDGLARLRRFRHWRAEEIARRLAKAGFAGVLEGARGYSNGELLSRTHFARFLVARGVAADVRGVFKRYLVRGKPGHVPGEWATLWEAVAWIRLAGGQAVLAHPARYEMTNSKRRRLLREFIEAGGVALEVISGSHSRDDCFHMAQLAREFGLLASAGSDYHGPESPWIELGNLPPLPDGLIPIWRDWPKGLA